MELSWRDLRKYKVFIDFDNTMTSFDVLDEIIRRFSINDKWKEIETAWQQGVIGSKEALTLQLGHIRVTQERLSRFLYSVRVAPYVKLFVHFLHSKGLHPVILSDNFSWIIRTILYNNRLPQMKIYANELTFSSDRLIPSFPLRDDDCPGRCGHCKRKYLRKECQMNTISIYIGDGLSDLCAAWHADVVFAKGTLLRALREQNLKCIPYVHFYHIHQYMKGYM